MKSFPEITIDPPPHFLSTVNLHFFTQFRKKSHRFRSGPKMQSVFFLTRSQDLLIPSVIFEQWKEGAGKKAKNFGPIYMLSVKGGGRKSLEYFIAIGNNGREEYRAGVRQGW